MVATQVLYMAYSNTFEYWKRSAYDLICKIEKVQSMYVLELFIVAEERYAIP